MRAFGMAALIVAGLFAAVDHSAQAAPVDNGYQQCEYEDSNNCVWDARHMGNGVGRSFMVTKQGKVIYLPHRAAHQLIAGC